MHPAHHDMACWHMAGHELTIKPAQARRMISLMISTNKQAQGTIPFLDNGKPSLGHTSANFVIFRAASGEAPRTSIIALCTSSMNQKNYVPVFCAMLQSTSMCCGLKASHNFVRDAESLRVLT
jgi:hypothetical protein